MSIKDEARRAALVSALKLRLFQIPVSAALALAAVGCGADKASGSLTPIDNSEALAQRAYVVSRDSEDLTVIDLSTLEVIAQVPVESYGGHMADISPDLKKVFITSSKTNETVVVDAERFKVIERIRVGLHPTHLSVSRDGRLVAVVNEDENSVSFLDAARHVELKRLGGLHIPHFVRFAPDGRSAYVANLGANYLTRLDINTLQVTGKLELGGYSAQDSKHPPKDDPPGDDEEFGFADAQIDHDGILYSAHRGSGRVLVYDVRTDQRQPEIQVGQRPWVAFAEHPFKNLSVRHLVPNFGDQTLSLIDGRSSTISATLPGDEEAYGVNYSSQAPDRAFVMNRTRKDIAVVDTLSGTIIDRVPVGGNTETAATTPDGKWILATVSSANQVVVLEAATHRIVKVFESVGIYPWSVTIPRGQNYCH